MAKITKKDATKFLAKVPEEYVFRCNDGGLMSDMKELARALNEMSDEVYAYHANDTKNDFSNWIKDVFKDEELAKDLKGIVMEIKKLSAEIEALAKDIKEHPRKYLKFSLF